MNKKGLHTPAPSEDASLLCHNLLHYQQRAGEESEEWAVKLGEWPPSPHAAKEKAFGLTCKVFRKKRIHSFPVCSSWKISAVNPVVRGSGFGEWLIGSKPHLVAQTENTPRRCPWRIRQRRKQRFIQHRKRELKAKTTHAQSLSVPSVACSHTSLKDVFFFLMSTHSRIYPALSGTKQGLESRRQNCSPQSLSLQQTEKLCLLKYLPRIRNHLRYPWKWKC